MFFAIIDFVVDTIAAIVWRFRMWRFAQSLKKEAKARGLKLTIETFEVEIVRRSK